MIYLFIFGMLVFLRYLLVDQSTLRIQLLPVLTFILFIFSAFRFQVGCDWNNYYEQYLGYDPEASNSFTLINEPLYKATLELVHFLGLTFPWVNVITSAIFFVGIYKLAIRQPDPLATIIFIFPILLLNMPMSGIRQGAAIGLMCFAYLAFIDKKLLKYIFYVILATGFHTSALIFLVLIPFLGGQFSYSRILVAILLAIPGIFFLLISSFAQIAIERYITNSYEAYGAIYRIASLAIAATMFLAFFRSRWKDKYEDEYTLIFLASLMMLFCLALLLVSSTISDRVGYYLIPLQAVFFARIPFFIIPWRIFWTMLPYILIGTIFVGWISLSSLFEVCYLPYHNFLLGVPVSEVTLF
mgnify:CR=1 FL=1|tara:strand:+ start:859 stop:1926 length:1068 start_codon:yes stop_codon:yes gene_type:complete